jgi:hypothetical protein
MKAHPLMLWTPDQIRGLGYVNFEAQGDQTKGVRPEVHPEGRDGQAEPHSYVFPVRHLTVPVDVEAVKRAEYRKSNRFAGSARSDRHTGE